MGTKTFACISDICECSSNYIRRVEIDAICTTYKNYINYLYLLSLKTRISLRSEREYSSLH